MQAIESIGTNQRAGAQCHICGCDEVVTDEVMDDSWLWLAECPRCDHRWTAPVTPPVRLVRARRDAARRREAVAAA